MRLRLLSLLLIVKVCRLNTVSRDVCPPLSHWKLTKPLNTREIYQENESLRYQCVDGYVRKAGTSNLIKCKRIGQVLQWTLPTLICIPSTTHKTTQFPTTHLSVPTERVSPRPTTLSSLLSQTLHSVTETQEVITTVTVTTTIISDITSVPVNKSSAVTSVSTKTVSPSESYCVPNRAPTSNGSTGKSSATAIYAGVGGVIVTILLVAAFGVLMFWRRKRMQRFDLSPTPDEIMQMNVVT
ncbi:interleukin-15 receptor subunit alpha-like isoform X5 [Oncorhynchus clarkii lewisi]|uniref:interleukin-15 receptor subunit alpha-like isoform X5 n=1 Tax=Oncorhynchus clarkii lewisi TaxID=490388 RepID=UPI0039B98D20